jgi:hypothetical protein
MHAICDTRKFRVVRRIVLIGACLFAGGCVTVESGLKYEYDGRLLRSDGKTPVNNAAVRLTRAGDESEIPGADPKKDKSQRAKSNKDGRFHGTLDTVKGFKYSEFFGAHFGPTRPPPPPVLTDVILYVQPQGQQWMGYRLTLAPDNQPDAISGVRKVHLPDVLLHDKPATTQSTTQPAPPQ